VSIRYITGLVESIKQRL